MGEFLYTVPTSSNFFHGITKVENLQSKALQKFKVEWYDNMRGDKKYGYGVNVYGIEEDGKEVLLSHYYTGNYSCFIMDVIGSKKPIDLKKYA